MTFNMCCTQDENALRDKLFEKHFVGRSLSSVHKDYSFFANHFSYMCSYLLYDSAVFLDLSSIAKHDF